MPAKLPPYYLPVSLSALAIAASFGLGATRLSAPVPETSAPASAAVQATVTAEDAVELVPTEAVPRRQKLRVKGLEKKVDIVGSGHVVESSELATFTKTMAGFEATGHNAGVVIYDLGTGASLSYRATQRFYPASSVKGPYVVSLFERLVDAGAAESDQIRRLAEPTIVDSDNDAYSALRQLCGHQIFADWAVDCGAIKAASASYDRFTSTNYPRMSTRELSRMWRHCFEYLDGGTPGAKELVELFERRVESPIRAGVEGEDLTITKAGWYPEDNGVKYEATVDAGIVMDGDHGYVLAIMTDAPADLDLLAELVPGFFSARVVLN